MYTASVRCRTTKISVTCRGPPRDSSGRCLSQTQSCVRGWSHFRESGRMTTMSAGTRSGASRHALPYANTVELDMTTDLRTGAAQRLASVGQMTSGVAHDLVNVLSVIDAGLQLAELNAGAPDTVHRCIAKARHGIDHGLRLAATLVAFAREQQTEARSEIVNDLLKDFEIFFRHGAGRSVRLSMDLESDIPSCMIDPTQFQAA